MSARFRSFLSWAVGAALVAAALLRTSDARADTKSCVASHASAQREAKAGRLRLATQLFTACGADNECPEQLRTECAELLEKVRLTIPTVIFSVLDERGTDVSNVKVFSTDELITDGLDGRAIEMDPGKHRLRFLLPWGDVLSSDVLIREGEKNRLVEVRLEKGANAEAEAEALPETKPPSPPPPPENPPPPRAEPAGPPVAAWVATGVAATGLAVFGTFALLGQEHEDALDACAPSCSPSQANERDALQTDYLIADIGLGVAAASTVVASLLFLSHANSEEQARRASSSQVAVVGGPGGAALFYSRRFDWAD